MREKIILLLGALSFVSADLSSLLNYETILPKIAQDILIEFAKSVGPANKNDICREFAILLSEELVENFHKIKSQVGRFQFQIYIL